MYILKNVSNNTLDILGKFINPNEEIQVINIKPYKKLISSGFLTIIHDNTDNQPLIVLEKHKYKLKANNYSINHKIINDINNKFPVKQQMQVDINQHITNELKEQINQDIDYKIDNKINQILQDKMNMQASNLNDIIDTKIKQQISIESDKQTKYTELEQLKIDNQNILQSLFHFYIDRRSEKY